MQSFTCIQIKPIYICHIHTLTDYYLSVLSFFIFLQHEPTISMCGSDVMYTRKPMLYLLRYSKGIIGRQQVNAEISHKIEM